MNEEMAVTKDEVVTKGIAEMAMSIINTRWIVSAIAESEEFRNPGESFCQIADYADSYEVSEAVKIAARVWEEAHQAAIDETA